MKRLLRTFLIIATSAYILAPLIDVDLWWHVTAGRWAIANRDVPHFDNWNLYGVGKPWVAYSWMSEVLYAQVDLLAGISTLIWVKFLLIVLFGLSLQLVFSRFARASGIGTALAVFVLCASYDHATLRPQLVSWILLPWAILLGNKIKTRGLNAICSVEIVLLFVVWANNHLSFAFGLVAFLVYLFGARLRSFLLAALLGLLGTCITPYWWKGWNLVFEKALHPIQFSTIHEFQSASLLEYSTSFQLILLFLVVFTFVLGPKPRPVIRLVFCLGVIALGLWAIKFLPYAFVISGALIAERWGASSSVEQDYRGLAEGLNKLFGQLERFSPLLLGFLMLAFIGFKLAGVIKSPMRLEGQPEAEVTFILQENLPGPILNNFGDGGYLIYRFSDKRGKPSRLVAIDGRTNVNDPVLIQHYQEALHGTNDWRNVIDYLKPKTIIWRNKWPLVDKLMDAKDWCLVMGQSLEKKGWSVFVDSRWLRQERPDLAALCSTQQS